MTEYADEGKGAAELILYRTEDRRDEIQLRLADGSVWLTQAEIAALFETTPQNITQHLGAIFTEGELSEEATCKQDLQVRQEGSAAGTISTSCWSVSATSARQKALLSEGARLLTTASLDFAEPRARNHDLLEYMGSSV